MKRTTAVPRPYCTVTGPDHYLTDLYQKLGLLPYSPSTSTPVSNHPVRDPADPSPVADDDDVEFVKEVSAPAVPDAAPPAPRAFAADAAGSSPLSVAPLSELPAAAPATDATPVTLRGVLQSEKTTVDLNGIAAFKKSTGFRKTANSKESHLLFLFFAAVFLGGQLKFAGADESAFFADALYRASRKRLPIFGRPVSPGEHADALNINIAVIQSDGTLEKYLCKRGRDMPWAVLAHNVYGGSKIDSKDWGDVLKRGDWTAVWFPSRVWFEANLLPHRDLSDAEEAAARAARDAVAVDAPKRARAIARKLEMLPSAEFDKYRLEPPAFYAAAEHPTSASQGYCTNLPQSLDGLMLPMMERSEGPRGGTLYLLAEDGDYKNYKQCFVAVVLLNSNLVTLTFKKKESARAILVPFIGRGARALTRTDNEYLRSVKNSDMMFLLTSMGNNIRIGTLKVQHEKYDSDDERAKSVKYDKSAKKQRTYAKRKGADPGSLGAFLHKDTLETGAAVALRGRRRRDEERTEYLNALAATKPNLKKYMEQLVRPNGRPVRLSDDKRRFRSLRGGPYRYYTGVEARPGN